MPTRPAVVRSLHGGLLGTLFGIERSVAHVRLAHVTVLMPTVSAQAAEAVAGAIAQEAVEQAFWEYLVTEGEGKSVLALRG